ncbi:MAG: hypothetical protein JNG90_06370 [Planctomycetaceae bacterium]|nr:hypothetical protein [Planctomycetaceae bacterium]
MMPILIAAAGLAEAGMFFYVLISLGVLCFAFAIAACGIWWRSFFLSITSLVILLLYTLMFQPWMCFSPFDEEDLADPDVYTKLSLFYAVGISWVGCCLASLYACARANPPLAVDELPGQHQEMD